MRDLCFWCLLYLLGNIQFIANASSKEQLFYDAVRLEASGNLEDAIRNYEQASKQETSANLHGNLANLYYKTNDYGRSILHYHKALLLDEYNRDFRSNLNYVCKMAQVELPNRKYQAFLHGFSSNFWKALLAFFFWTGLLILSFLFFRRSTNKSLVMIFTFWLIGNLVLTFSTYHSSNQSDISERKVIALHPHGMGESNSSSNIPLRRFAAKTSSENANVRPGETLIIDKSQLGDLQSHTSPNALNWLLVSTLDNRKKGWVLEEEIGWIMKN